VWRHNDVASSTTSLNGNATISFSGLTANGASVTGYTESGFTLSAMSGDWSVRTDYGNPAPFTQFWSSASIVLTNAAAACCRNPMGLDTVVLTR
jgi:hypothetical protein